VVVFFTFSVVFFDSDVRFHRVIAHNDQKKIFFQMTCLTKGWGVMFASKFNCVLKICFSSDLPEILKDCELACQIYIPGKAYVKSRVVLLPGNGNYHLVYRHFVPRTFFLNIGQVVCHFDRLSLLIHF
jgi:hypothetical protein